MIRAKKRADKPNDGKPLVYDELIARMRAVLRRSNGPRHPRLSVCDLEIDLASRVVTVSGESVQLSAKEYELVVALAEDPERVFKKKELLRNVSGFRLLGSKHHKHPTFGPASRGAPTSALTSTGTLMSSLLVRVAPRGTRPRAMRRRSCSR